MKYYHYIKIEKDNEIDEFIIQCDEAGGFVQGENKIIVTDLDCELNPWKAILELIENYTSKQIRMKFETMGSEVEFDDFESELLGYWVAKIYTEENIQIIYCPVDTYCLQSINDRLSRYYIKPLTFFSQGE